MKLLWALIFIIAVSTDGFPNSMGDGRGYRGFGITAEYSYDHGGSPDRYPGLYASYRTGIVDMVSGFIAADAGYQFREKSVNARLGVQGMILLFGFEAGFSSKYKSDPRRYYPGAYLGLVSFLPLDSMAATLSVGGNVYPKHQSELYCRLTTFFHIP